MSAAVVESLHVYPVKSCRGVTVQTALLAETGLLADRHWMIVNEAGRFVTQRELPRLALIETLVEASALRMRAPGCPELQVARDGEGSSRDVIVWRDTVAGLDAGDDAAAWLSDFLEHSVRLVRFNPSAKRLCNPQYAGDTGAHTQFADGFGILAVAEASLTELNSRLQQPLPMNRFRPNIVLAGLQPYDEDRIDELSTDGVRLRFVKPCTRCKITTTDQATGVALGDEPLATLKMYRWDSQLRGVTFGQNVIVVAGAGRSLSVGQELAIRWKA